jgi:hypothetical protein
MIKIEAKRTSFFIFIFIVVLIISTFGQKLADRFDRFNKDDEYELIRKYLLNDLVDLLCIYILDICLILIKVY